MVDRLIEVDEDRLLEPDGAVVVHRARDEDIPRQAAGRPAREGGEYNGRGDEDHAHRRPRPREASRPEGFPPPGHGAPSHAPRPVHELASQRRAEGVVEGRVFGHAARPQQRGALLQLCVLQDVVELWIVVHAHSAGLKVRDSSRRRLTPRWMRSLTAPAVLPIATAMSSIFMSSWNLSMRAVFC